MAFADNNGARIFWWEMGRGEPIVLLMGLGCSSAMWFRIAPRLARTHRVILLDNRGVGQTEAGDRAAHRVAAMAEDVAAVLDAAGEATAHILGFSMGGMIAQQFAIDHPARVRSLTLLSTNCGSAYAVLADRKVTDLLFSKGEQLPEQALRIMQPFVYAKSTPAHLIDEDTVIRLASYPALRGYLAQLNGLIYWSSYTDLPNLRAPTLIIHGQEDQLIPPQNGRMLAKRIPGAELVELAGASHWAPTDQTDAVVKNVVQFLTEMAPA